MNSKIILVLLAGSLIFTCAVGAQTATAPELKHVRSYDGAGLYKANKFNVLVLKGSYAQMGKQYGRLMKDELNKMYDLAIKRDFVETQKLSYDVLREASLKFYDAYPARFKAIVDGMAEGSGIDKEKLIMLGQVVTLVGYTKTGVHCSGIAAWGPYTSGGPLVFGRDFDYPPYFKDFAELMTIVVYNPADGSIPVAQIGYAGQMDTLTAMNQAGLFTEINDGAVSGGRDLNSNRLVVTVLPFTFLLDSSTMGQLDSAIGTARADYAILYNVADKNMAYSYEWSIDDVRRRLSDADGLMVATNHFLDPAWKSPEPEGDPYDTIARRKNLLALGEKYKGAFNPEIMMAVLDLPYDKGGVTRDWTIYEIVAVPAELKIWLKAPGYQDWTEIELGKLFEW